jgi:hypothetical protein
MRARSNSCDTLARKADFARLTCSASSRALIRAYSVCFWLLMSTPKPNTTGQRAFKTLQGDVELSGCAHHLPTPDR